MKNLIFIGPPGCGKGTISNILKGKGYQHISTGDLLRNEVKKGTSLGKEINDLISKGNLVSDELAVSLIKNNTDFSNPFILDGFPRTENQALLLKNSLNIDAVPVFFEIDQEKLVDRLTNRRVCSCGEVYNLKLRKPKKENHCNICGKELIHREDDKESVIKKRFEVFTSVKSALKSIYKESLIELNADLSVDEVLSELFNKIK